MNALFGAPYAELYDLIYQEKSYGEECDAIEALFGAHARLPMKTVLDLGCGTGSHALELARRGYQVLGVDQSAPMLRVATEKAERVAAAAAPHFRQGDVRNFRSPVAHDAVLMMFAVLGYLVTDDDLAAALATVEANLRRGGLFVFDVWYGPAVERLRPSRRTRLLRADADGELRRVVSGELAPATRTCRVTIELERRRGRSTGIEASEVHPMRYFDRPELEALLDSAGLELLGLTAFPSTQQRPDETTWNVLGVARKR